MCHKTSDRGKDNKNEWTVNVKDIVDTDLSAKNPHTNTDIEHLPPLEIIAKIKKNDEEIGQLMSEVESILKEGYDG